MINKSAFWPVQPNNLSSAAETRNSNQTNIRNYVKCRKIVPGQVEKKLLSSLSRRDASLVRNIVHLKLFMTVVSTVLPLDDAPVVIAASSSSRSHLTLTWHRWRRLFFPPTPPPRVRQHSSQSIRYYVVIMSYYVRILMAVAMANKKKKTHI
jgi:hypothetical protein